MEKSKGTAIASFIFGLFFWIPLINLICGALAIHLGIKALIKIKKDPMKYSGKLFAIAGIILGLLVYATYLTGIGICLLGFKDICKNVGLSFLA
mgnify:FL=1